MKSWLVYSFLAFIFWGFFGLFPKMSMRYLDPKSALLYQLPGTLVVYFILITQLGFKLPFNIKGFILSFLAGFLRNNGLLVLLSSS